MALHARAVLARPQRPRFVILLTATRAALAYLLGIALLLYPERGVADVAGFMGAYWLLSGLFSLAWARRGPFLQKLALLSGCVGVAAGIFVLIHTLGVASLVSPEQQLGTLGLVIGLTGVLHTIGGFMVGERIDRWPAGHLLLGAIEIILAGVLLFGSSLALLEMVVTVWAFVSGSVLAFDAVRASRRWSTA